MNEEQKAKEKIAIERGKAYILGIVSGILIVYIFYTLCSL